MWMISYFYVNNYFSKKVFFIFYLSSICYDCTDDVTEWTKPSYSITTTSTRKMFDIPDDIKIEYDAL